MRFFVGICASIVVLITAAPALAVTNITGASISTGTPSYTGKCPATINFTGAITGVAGTKFTYSFNRFINGAQQVVAGGTVAMPPNGTFPVSDAITINASTSGNTFDQIWVHGISGGQSDVYSNDAHYSVTCGAPPTPSPVPSRKPLHIHIVRLISNLHQTGNAQECGSHGGGFACPAALANGWLVLVWCWPNGNACVATSTSQGIKAWKIYEVDNGKHALVDTVQPYSDGTLATLGIVQTPQGGFANQCYAVSQILGDSFETSPSQPICLGSGTVGNVSTPYQATASTVRSQSSQYGNVPFRAQCDIGPLCLGWQHDQSSIIGPSVIPIWWYADNNRVYFRFDGLNAIKGHYIASAMLKLDVKGGDVNCFSAIAAADTDWNGNNGYIGGNFETPGGSIGSPSGLDVTDIVRAWVAGAPNYGFVLRGSNESLVAESTKCLLNFGTDATLTVVHS